MRTLITGATGLIGRALVSRVGSAVVLSRHPEQAAQRLGSVEAYAWSAEAGPPPVAALRGVDTVFNLAGEPVAEGRWSADRKRRIRDSRVLGTRHLVAGLAAADPKPKVLVSASAVGFYGDRGDEVLDEASPRGSGFLADVCVEWEREALAAQKLGVRVVSVRIGIVLAAEGSALEKMLPLFRLGVGGRTGMDARTGRFRVCRGKAASNAGRTVPGQRAVRCARARSRGIVRRDDLSPELAGVSRENVGALQRDRQGPAGGARRQAFLCPDFVHRGRQQLRLTVARMKYAS
jgi:hypothetical protein